MEQKYKKNSYEEAFYGFQERGLYLDTPREDFEMAAKLGAIINFDDISHIDFSHYIYNRMQM